MGVGGVNSDVLGSGRANRQFRRRLYVTADVPAGARLSRDNIRSVRPGNGLPPGDLDKVLGRPAARPLSRGEPLDWDMIG